MFDWDLMDLCDIHRGSMKCFKIDRLAAGNVQAWKAHFAFLAEHMQLEELYISAPAISLDKCLDPEERKQQPFIPDYLFFTPHAIAATGRYQVKMKLREVAQMDLNELEEVDFGDLAVLEPHYRAVCE